MKFGRGSNRGGNLQPLFWQAAGLVVLATVLLEPGWAQRTKATAGEGVETASAGAGSPERAKAPAPAAAATQSSGQISESQLAGLPLNGRSYSQLATLQAGVSDSSAGSASRGTTGGSLTVAGGRSTSNNFLLDGTNIMDTENSAPRSAAGVQLGSDAVMQVQVFSSTYGPEYGRGSGGVLNSISRAGNNELHGTFFEYFRNSKLDTRNFFDAAAAPPFKRNQFGGTVSGAIRKDHSYFLVSFEAMRDRLNTTDVSFLPDAAARAGFPDSNGVPTVPVDSRVKPYLALYPMPNDISIGRGVARNLQPQFLPTDENFYTARLDQKLTTRDSFFVHYTFDDANSPSPGDTYLFQTTNRSRQQYLTLIGSHIFSTRTLMAYRAAYTRPAVNVLPVDNLGVPPSLYFVPGAPAFGQILVPGLSTLGPEATLRKRQIMNTFQYAFDLIATRGSHGLKLGMELHRYRWDVESDYQKAGVWAFNSLDNFLKAGPVGTNVSVSVPGGENLHALRQYLLGLYAQDDYKLRPRLALSLGLRYEFASQMTDNLNRISYMPDPVHDTTVQLGRLFQDNPSVLNFAPRVGFTWTPRQAGETVVSAGFGIYYDQILGQVANHRKNSLPYQTILINPNAKDAQKYFPDPIAAAGDVGGLVQIMDYRHSKTPMVMRYSFTLQQRMPGGWRMQASYVGARGNSLLRRYESNQFPVPIQQADGSLLFPAGAGAINPVFGSISMISSDGQSFYNSLQMTASKNLSRGFSLQSSYSYSKSVDDNSTGYTTNAGQYALLRTLDRALSDFDIRHRLTLSYFYSLPGMSRKGGSWNERLLSQLLGGWRLGGIASFRTGTSFSPAANVRYTDYLFSPSRPNLGAGQSNNPTAGVTAGCGRTASGDWVIPPGQKLGTPERYFDPCVFSAPAPGTLGNAGRNTITAPSIFSMDLSLQKEFLLDSKRRLQFRGEIFNLPNHTNFNGATGGSATVVSGESGNYTARAGRITQTNTTSRQLQFALRLSF